LFNSSLTCFQVGGIESPLKTPVSGEYSSLFQTHNAKWNRYPWMKRDQGGMLWRDFGQGSLHHTFPTVSVKHNPACRPPCGIGPLRKGIRYLSNRGRLWQRIPLLRRIGHSALRHGSEKGCLCCTFSKVLFPAIRTGYVIL